MLVDKETTGNSSSKYICDRCKRGLNSDDRRGVYILYDRRSSPRKEWDLCLSCFRALKRGIEKGKK